MANFTVVNTTLQFTAGQVQQAVTTTYKTLVLIHNASVTNNVAFFSSGITNLRVGKLYDLLVGTNGTPADNFMEWDVTRLNGGASTPTNLLPVSCQSTSCYLDLSQAGAGTPQQIAINTSLETQITPTNEIWYVGVNQRASYRWVAAPGSELVWPANTSATGNNGVAGRVRSGGYTGTATMNWLWQEQ